MKWTTARRCIVSVAARATGHCFLWWHVSTTHTKTNSCCQPLCAVTVPPASVRTTVGEHSLPFLWHGVFRRKNGFRKIILRWMTSNCVSDTVWPVIRKSVTTALLLPIIQESILSATTTLPLWYLPPFPIRIFIGKRYAKPTSVWIWACSIHVSTFRWMPTSKRRQTCWWKLPSLSPPVLKILLKPLPMPAKCVTKEWKWPCAPSTWKVFSLGNLL